MNAGEIVDAYRADMKGKRGANEFPVTPMSDALARATEGLCTDRGLDDLEKDHALDFGTGSGIQAAVLAKLGFNAVDAIDVCNDAISHAEARWDRLKRDLRSGGVRFSLGSFKEVLESGSQYNLLSTNPPSYFGPDQPQNPLEYGIFDWSDETDSSERGSFLYKFFDQVVRNCLMPGGIVICTWPALQSRLTYKADGYRHCVHPIELLRMWFGWDISCRNETSNKFFERLANARYSGLDDPHWLALKAGILSRNRYSKQSPTKKPDLYSDRVQILNDTLRLVSFPYGILALRRDQNIENRFQLIPLHGIGV